jgi:hypothetical protein
LQWYNACLESDITFDYNSSFEDMLTIRIIVESDFLADYSVNVSAITESKITSFIRLPESTGNISAIVSDPLPAAGNMSTSFSGL